MVHKATVTKEGKGDYQYVGQTSTTFKARLGNHKSGFKNRNTKGTSLSKFIWRLKDEQRDWSIKWSKLSESEQYRRESGRCKLDLDEKLQIMKLMKQCPQATINK